MPRFERPGAVAESLNGLVSRLGLCDMPCFEHSSQVHSAMGYERQVATGVVPTRDCLHDWYNGLVWALYPKTRRLMNQQHLQEGSSGSSGNSRTPMRDAITLVDESGAVLLADDPKFFGYLREHDWYSLLVGNRQAWGNRIKLVLVGHGLLEALHRPYKGLCAKVLCLPLLETSNTETPQSDGAALDARLCDAIACLCTPKDLHPLPVMGVPGWFEENADPTFYEDRQVFREKPTR